MPPVAFLELPDAPQQRWIAGRDEVPRGQVEVKTLASALLKNERRIWVYTPPNYASQWPERYPLLVAFDGMEYVQAIPVPVILDNLIAANLIPPMVAIVLDNPTPTSRNVELPCSLPFAEFLAKEVVPWMRDNYHATDSAAATVVGGSSYGGLAAIFAGLRHPEVFGNVLAQSASLWWAPEGENEPEWLARQFANTPKLPLRLQLEVGLMRSEFLAAIKSAPTVICAMF